MDKYTKAVLIVIAVSVLALPVKAEEKVWYCEMTGLAQIDANGVESFQPQKFKMKVTPEKVVFGSGGAFNDLTESIDFWAGSESWGISGNGSSGRFREKMFHYVFASHEFALAISARCDDF